VVDDEVGRRRDAAATKAALLSAAQELFTERGFDRTTVRDIAARAGANQALLFRYFGSKEALFRAAMASQAQQFLAQTSPEQLVGRMLSRILAPDAKSGMDNSLHALLRSAGNEYTGAVFRDDLGEPYRRVLASLTDADDADTRADLVLAWLLGIGLVRSVLDETRFPGEDRARIMANVLRAAAVLLERVDQRLPAVE
jgi:AcrR family transcriptional regulator